jgi:polysaccharide export outer membrane protein
VRRELVSSVAPTWLVCAWLATLVFAGCASSERPRVASPPPIEADSTLGPGDSFEVSVYGQADLSGKHQIGADGTINFPLVGRIDVQGKGAVEIAASIRAALVEKQILRDPHVSVFLLGQTSKQVSVMGAVTKPGTYPMTSGMTVIEAVGAAGGLTALASGNSAILTRRVEGQLKRFKVPIESISEGEAEDFTLQSGDIVFVPERIF